jgi:PAS domain-containing protein
MRDKHPLTTAKLRQQAEAHLTSYPFSSGFNYSEYDNLNLIHELQVHQVELEMQNDELQVAKEKIDEIAEKYIELYNFAPLGYFTLTKEAKIIELNFFGSQMLGKEHKITVNSQFGFFVSDEDRSVFDLFLRKIVSDKLTETCVVKMCMNDNLLKQVFLTGSITKNGEYCLIGAIDISERMQLEKESTELHQFNDYFVGREIRMVELKKEINQLLHKGGFENKYPV